jgi:hypothetical protein
LKKISILIFVLFFSLVNAKEFEFDTMVIYTVKFMQTEGQAFCFTNSKNDTYCLKLSKLEDSYEGRIYDYNDKKVHYFRVENIKSDTVHDDEFVFLYTSDLSGINENWYSKYLFEFKTIDENESYKKVKLNVYKNSKRKKSIMSYDFELILNDTNLFSTFRLSCIHPFEFVSKFNMYENYLVKNAVGNTLSGKKIENNLLVYKKVNFSIRIP